MKKSRFAYLLLALIFAGLQVSVVFGQQSQTVHVVQRGESFASIAAKYGISENELKQANPNARTCIAGMKLTVKQNVKKSGSNSADKAKTTTKPTLKTERTTQTTAAPRKLTRQKKSGSPYFEGRLLYRSYEHHSKVTIKYSRGQAYNGERTTIATVKGNVIHILDEDMHLHTIIDLNKNVVYYYSDVSRKGISARADEYLPLYRSMFDPNVPVSTTEKISTLQNTGRSLTYKGDLCKVYAGQLTVGEYMQDDIEMWYTDKFLINKCYRYLFWGLPVEGIVRKGIINQSGYAALLGEMKSTMAYELMALSEYDVDDNELMPPSDVRFEKMTGPVQLDNYLKDNYKTLKKKKLLPKPMKTSEVDYSLRSEWDFADEWLAKEYKLNKSEMNWGKVGTRLFETLTTLSSIGGSSTSDVTSTLTVVGETVADVSGETFSPVIFNEESLGKTDISDEIDEKQFSPEVLRKYKQLSNRMRHAANQQYNANKQVASYTRMKATVKANEYRRKANEYKKEFEALSRERHNLIQDAKHNISEAAKKKREETEQAGRKMREDYLDRRTERQNQSDYRSGEGLKYVRWYSEEKLTINSIKNKDSKYKDYSIDEKRNMIRKCQQKMKEYRKEYSKHAGQDIIVADDYFENWQPRDEDLIW